MTDNCNYCKHSIKDEHFLDPDDCEIGCLEGICLFGEDISRCDCYYDFRNKIGISEKERWPELA